MRRVSMTDVAAAAGVSGQTVSRVVNGSPRVSPETRARVEEAMAELGYRMHRTARALRTGRTDAIGLVVSTLATVGNSRMLQAIADAAEAYDFALTVVTAADSAAVERGFARLRDQGVDGAIVLNEATAFARAADVPPELAVVIVDVPVPPGAEGAALTAAFGVVQTDHAAGAALATRYLLSLDRGPVWHLAGPSGSFAADERERGWRMASAAAGAAEPDVLRGDWTAASGYTAAQALPGDARVLFAANDQMALGALRALTESGRRIPEDVAVVGFDDVPDSANYRPPLSTVGQDFDALGKAAVAQLARRIEGRTDAGVTIVPTRFVPRESA